MCGITGLFRRGGPAPGDAERLVAMTESLVHRGPDDHGRLLLDSRSGRYQLDAGVGDAASGDVLLGNRRLAIIDCSPAGRQPMANARGDLFLTFNGEVYNYIELREELRARGRGFVSGSDTEVVLQAYEEWGPDCVRRFNGMWAFALWDQRRRRLFCSRDRFGAKPFYYRVDAGLFAFGSEIKAILRAGLDRPAPHWPTVLDFLVHSMCCHTSETFFEGIHRLPAAHNLVVTRDRVELSRYWDYTDQSHGYDFGRPEATFTELFDDAVRLRLRSDVPVGVALSGGIDSASVTAVARRHLPGAPLRVFTATFPGKPYDELRYAELVARRFDAELHTLVYRPERLIDDLRTVIWHMDYPTPHSQILARWRLMGLAARHIKVILEGQGSDEMLAGYPFRYFPHHVAHELGRHTRGDLVRRYGRLLAESARMAYGLGRNAIPAIAGHVVPPLNLLRPAVHLQHSVISPDLRKLVPRDAGPFAARTGPFGDRVTNALHVDHERAMLPQLLKFGDGISMGHSLEARMPFLDYRLVEFVFGLPLKDKYDGVTTKLVLKRAMTGLVPPEIIGRTDKVGFQTPVEDWLGDALEDEVRPLLLSPETRQRGVFDHAVLTRALGERTRLRRGLAVVVFRWVALEVWFRLFVDAPLPSPACALAPAVDAG